tara:strand:- start:36 stop:584 length:549 start_codon:yes stop_codon:yes gene_type:complete
LIIEEQSLENVLLLKPEVFKDKRGYFFESYRDSVFKENNFSIEFVQDNEVLSKNAGIIRGLHYQLEKPQGKLIHVIAGAITDIIVDIRLGSPNFGKSIKIRLDSESHNMVYIPKGFAHGYLVHEENTIIQYKCTNYYDPSSEFGIRWDDKDLNIFWDVDSPIISDKDNNLPKLKEQTNLPIY